MLNDFRYAIRAFLRAPGFSIVALVTLALGIGATTAIFSVVNAVLLKPLPYSEADRLVVSHLSLPDFHDVETSVHAFDGTAVWASNMYNVRTDGESQQVLGGVVSETLLPLLGVQPVLGRWFTKEDQQEDTVIIGYGLWQSRFGGDAAVLGRTVDLSGTVHTIIGVAPAWFRFPSAEFQLWTPIGSIESKAPEQAQNRALRIFNLLGRLKPGTTLQQARAEAAALSTDLQRKYPATNANVGLESTPCTSGWSGRCGPASNSSWELSASFCSSPARTSPISCWRGPPFGSARWRFGSLWGPAVHDSSDSSPWRASCSRLPVGHSGSSWRCGAWMHCPPSSKPACRAPTGSGSMPRSCSSRWAPRWPRDCSLGWPRQSKHSPGPRPR